MKYDFQTVGFINEQRIIGGQSQSLISAILSLWAYTTLTFRPPISDGPDE